MGVNFTKVFDLLLPDSPSWDLTNESPLKKFTRAIAAPSEAIREHLASSVLDLFPAYTSKLHDWSVQFGSLEDYDSDELLAQFRATGGQDPKYLQDTLRGLGVDVYVHECWDKSTSPSTLRNPMPYIDNSYVLVNDLTSVERNYLHQFGDGTEFGAGAQFGAYDGHYLQRKRYPCPDVENEYPVYWYVCGETWPNQASIPASKLEKLIRMIFRIKPMQTRVILRTTTYPDREIQDVYTLTDPEYQDTVDGDDILQDE